LGRRPDTSGRRPQVDGTSRLAMTKYNKRLLRRSAPRNDNRLNV